MMPRLGLFLPAFLFLSLHPPRAATHCQQFPKSTCEQHTAFVPGHNLAGEGIDITTLERKGAYLVDTSQWLDPNGTCVLCQNPLMDGQLQRLPLAGVDWRVHVSCHRQVSSSVEHSDVDVAKALAGEVKNNWKIELNLPKEMESVATGQVVLVGSRSQMVIYAHEKAQRDRYSFVRHEISCEHYRLRLLPRRTLLSHHFSHAVGNLPSKYDPEEYQHFIDTYGTHYISQAQLGGRVRNLLAVRTCGATLAGFTASDIKDCLTLEASLGPDWMAHSLSLKCHELRRKQAKGMFWEAYGQRRTEVVGGDSQVELLFAEPGEVPLISEWMENLKTSPGIISYSLLPIHTLMDRGDPRREMLKETVRDYIAQRALWRNCTQQCPNQSYPNAKNPCICICHPDAITDAMCCAQERGLAHLQVHIQNGSGLWADHFSATDAYVKVFFQGREMRTSFIKNNNHPWWSETLDFGPIKLTGLNYIEVQIWDKDTWHDDLLATCYEGLVTGGKVWKKCYPTHGRVEYYYVLECGPTLGGTSCHDYIPQKQH